MAIWHWMIGIGFAVLAAVVTQYKALPSSHSNRHKDTFVDDLNGLCVICLENRSNSDAQYLSCGHAFHQRCVANLRKYKLECPLCRRDVI